MKRHDMTVRERLDDLARNLRWAWHAPTRSLFERLDPSAWERLGHNPVALLRRLDPSALEAPELAADVEAAWRDLHDYLASDGTWYSRSHDDEAPADRPLSAYFSAEFAITESLRIYSGGLGVLAGDHLKSASDLGVPLVAVGLFYREGYFQQELGPDGGQAEQYPVDDVADLPLREVERPDGAPLRIAVPFPGRQVSLKVWRVDVGRVPLFLLDADVPENAAADREITARLYGGDQETRIAQETLLGIGGYRALREMEVRPRSFHMNEGHSAFLGLDLVRDIMEAEGLKFEAAAESAAERCVFTTHTPVPAGHDRFPPALMARYFTHHARALGIGMDELMALGREDPDDDDAPFTMTVLAVRLSAVRNGVSRLHGQVSREMWHGLWPDRSMDDVPIDHITNGVHLPSWVDDEVGRLYGVDPALLGTDGRRPEPDPEALWRLRQRLRKRLVDDIARRTGARLDPDALTIAFARRFATYKRATLILGDPDRLAALLDHDAGPVQLVFAGKAHPRDEGGKALIQAIASLSREPRFRDRIVFVPGYSMDVGRALVRGADVWLNNPRRPLEASGTSGMKAAANGVLNVSILDGWWDEAWRDQAADGPRIGWAIEPTEAETRARGAGSGAGEGAGEGAGGRGSGNGRRARARGGRDRRAGGASVARPRGSGADRRGDGDVPTVDPDAADAAALFRVLGDEVIPTFYDRNGEGLPTEWVRRMTASVRTVAPVFNTNRMVREYVERYQRVARPAGSGVGGRSGR